MTMKKILAGVLAAASVMAMSVTASAVEAPDKTKAITKPGSAEYEAGIGFLTAELDVELPGQMKAFLNPYGASVAVTEKVGTTDPVKLNSNIVSWAYEVVNNTEDFAIGIDVVGAKATPSSGVSIAASVADADTTKKAVVVLKSADDPADLAYDSATDTANGPGCVVFTTTATDTKKFASAPAKNATTKDAGKTYIGITGALTPIDNVDWTEDDTITCAYTLKINPSSDAAGGDGGADEASWAASTGIASQPIGTGLTFEWVSGNTYNLKVSDSLANTIPDYGFDSGWTIDDATATPSGVLTVRSTDGRISAAGNAGDTCVLTVTARNGSDTATVTVNVTLE